MAAATTTSSIQQRISDFEARLRSMFPMRGDARGPSAPSAGVKTKALSVVDAKLGSRTSPLPRRPMPLNGCLNGTERGSITYRSRKRMDFDHWTSGQNRQSDSVENERRLNEIIKKSGTLSINGKKYFASPADMEEVGVLGHSTSGSVVKMLLRPAGFVLAVKQMRRTGNKEEKKRLLMDLDVVLRSYDCPYIVQCYGILINEADVWICMQLMATCFDKLKKQLDGGVPERILGKVAVSVLKALHYLKEKHAIMHRDVKPSNMLLDWNGTVKLCDFGISGHLVDSKAKTRSAGCVAYLAPERINPPDPSRPSYDIRADVWSLGVSLVELATGSFPYAGCTTDFEVLCRVIKDEPPILTPSQEFSPEFCSFVCSCLTKDVDIRPKYSQLLEHPFIRRYEGEHVDVSSWYAQVMAKKRKESHASSTDEN